MQKEFTSAGAVMEKDETQGADPAVLAKLVCSIVNKPSPALRCLSGMALQKITVLLKAVLPAKVFESIIAGHYGIQ